MRPSQKQNKTNKQTKNKDKAKEIKEGGVKRRKGENRKNKSWKQRKRKREGLNVVNGRYKDIGSLKLLLYR